MNSLMEISAGVGIVNVALLIALLTVYAKVYKCTRAVVSVGLMFFAGMLVLHNIIAVYAYFAMEPLYAVGLLPYFVVVHIAELTGIAVLLKVTL
jgi:hypothetical protein